MHDLEIGDAAFIAAADICFHPRGAFLDKETPLYDAGELEVRRTAEDAYAVLVPPHILLERSYTFHRSYFHHLIPVVLVEDHTVEDFLAGLEKQLEK